MIGRIRVAWLIGLIGAGSALPTLAQSAQDDPYQVLVTEAIEEFRLEHFAEARRLFSEAHRLRPNARTLRGISVTAYELRAYREAIRAAREALASQVEPLTPEQAAEMNTLLQKASRFVGEYRIQRTPESATLTIDGAEVELTADGSVLLPIGRHVVRASAPGHVAASEEIDTRGGETQVLAFVLEPQVSDPSPRRPASEHTATERKPALLWPIAVTAAGVAALLAGTVTGLMAEAEASELEAVCPDPSHCDERYRPTRDSAADLATATDVLWVGGAALAAGGATWLLVELSGERQEAVPVPRLSPHGAGLSVRGQF